MDISFETEGDKICLPITEFLLRSAAGDLVRSKNQRDWTPRNAVLIPPFFTEAAILNLESDAGEILKCFAQSVTERAEEGEDADGDDNVDDNNKNDCDDKNEKGGQKENVDRKNEAGHCQDVGHHRIQLRRRLGLPPGRRDQVTTSHRGATLSSHGQARASGFVDWMDTNITTPPKPAQKNHMGLMGVLTDVATRL